MCIKNLDLKEKNILNNCNQKVEKTTNLLYTKRRFRLITRLIINK